jgi:hypothetical protein
MRGLSRMNSGEARYFANSESQSDRLKGGSEPVTGRHSVILRLKEESVKIIQVMDPSAYTYPDSVSRVKPPNMTIPKTLAALPRSQYATALSVVFGNPFVLEDD